MRVGADDILTWENKDGIVVFHFHGSIESDVTAVLRQKIIVALTDERSGAAIFDLSDTNYIDSMGIGMFVHLHVQHHEHVKFLFCNLSDSVSKAFGYVKLISFFHIRESLEDALEELKVVDS